MRIDQFVPGFVPHDAISNHVLQIKHALVDAGYQSDIYAEVIDAGMPGQPRPFGTGLSVPSDAVLLYHASTDSRMFFWLVAQARAGSRLFVDYHNITPATYFSRWFPEAASGLGEGRAQLAALASYVEFAAADSAYNESELIELGYRDTATCPLLVDLHEYHDPPREKTLQSLEMAAGTGKRWLFVGRLAANKCQHDVIAAFAVYRLLYDRAARLSLVGGAAAPRYLRACQLLAQDLGVEDAVDFVHQVDHADLLAHFGAADVFVCLSEHEGFCVPIIEAMELGVPVVAYASTAVPGTVADGGTVLKDKDPLTVATAVGELLADPTRRNAQVAAGRARASQFSLDRTTATMLDALRSRLDAAPVSAR